MIDISVECIIIQSLSVSYAIALYVSLVTRVLFFSNFIEFLNLRINKNINYKSFTAPFLLPYIPGFGGKNQGFHFAICAIIAQNFICNCRLTYLNKFKIYLVECRKIVLLRQQIFLQRLCHYGNQMNECFFYHLRQFLTKYKLSFCHIESEFLIQISLPTKYQSCRSQMFQI